MFTQKNKLKLTKAFKQSNKKSNKIIQDEILYSFYTISNDFNV